MKRFAPLFLIVIFGIASISCMAVNRALFGEPPSPTPVPPTLTPIPSPTPSPAPSLTPTPDSCPNGDCITACLGQLRDLSQIGGPSTGPKSMHRAVETNQDVTLVTYTITGDQIKDPVDGRNVSSNLKTYQKDRPTQQRIWNYFAAIIPPEQRKFLDEYIVFTDGKSNILAFVAQSDNSPNEWVLSVDILDATNPKDLTYTLVHEYGHLLTLNPSEVVPSQLIFDNPKNDKIYEQEAAACKTYFPGEGCSNKNSYVNQFFERFWPKIQAEWVKINDIQDENDYYRALNKFYEAHKDQFVTDYAPTNPAEDIAESFSYFILRTKPTGNSIADQKVLFFYDFPELVQLRSQMGRRLCDQLKK